MGVWRRRRENSAEEAQVIPLRVYNKPLFNARSWFDWFAALCSLVALVIIFIMLTEVVGWLVDKITFWN